ncbi:peroxisomal ATPase PEX1-like [Glandiceps talaboti]
MSSTTVVTIEYSNSKTSFITLPASIASEYQNLQNAAFELVWGDDNKAYVSWSGEVTRKDQNDTVIELNGLYANKLGLQNGEQVLLKPISSMPSCSRTHLEPVTVDDWEILEIHAGYVESQLLSQLRIVWTGQVFPLWINKSLCIFMKTGSVEPSIACYARLEQYTEVIVAPKSRTTKPDPKPTTNQPRKLEDSKRRKSKADLESVGTAVKNNESPKIAGIREHCDDPAQQTEVANNEGLFDKYLKTESLEWSLYPMWYASKVYNYVRGHDQVQDVDPKQDKSVRDSEEESDTYDDNGVNLNGINMLLRVHPMCDSVAVTESLSRSSSYAHHMTQQAVSHGGHMPRVASQLIEPTATDPKDKYSHLMQPTTVYIKRQTLIDSIEDIEKQSRVESMTTAEYSSFLAVLSKAPSPKDKLEEYRKKILENEDKNKKRPQEKKIESKNRKGEKITTKEERAPSFTVRVVVCNDDVNALSTNQYPTISMATEYSTGNEVQLQDLFRRQLNLEITSKVQLQGLQHLPSPVTALTLHPVIALPDAIGKPQIIGAFHIWLTCVSCMMYPLPINQGALVRFPITKAEDVYGEFLITVPSTTDSPQTEYFLLHPFIARKVTVKVADKLSSQNKPPTVPSIPCINVSVIDPPVIGPRLRDLGGVGEIGQQALDHLKVSLSLRPLVSYLCKSTNGLLNGALLIHGPKGIGKSNLAKALAREVSEWPYLCYTTVIGCKQLKGKRVENIRKVWEEAFQEAFWRQPSVIILDDLDHVTSAPLGPEQEVGPEAVYNTRVAQTFKDIIMSSLSSNHKIVVIATSKSQKTIHSSLVATRGTHIFQSIIEMTPPDLTARKEILMSVIEAKTEVDLRSIDVININSVGSRTEGYVARDMVTLVERAIHSASRRKLVEKQSGELGEPEGNGSEILLTDTDFEVALDDYTPLSLLNVPLHSAGTLGWQDVGGLTDVKTALTETLQLPAKYPGLFANCPLRLRSGLLLYGAPGTGKTLLAGVVAKECGLHFISIKGPELLSKYIGASEQAVRDMFTRAQSAKPCILFFDEFDSLAPRRGHDSTGVTDRVVNQLLTQLDGVESLDGVYVLAATSRPDLIDPALLRPGRLDKCLYCPLPNKDDRLEILEALARNMELDDDVELPLLAEQCEGYTGADFKALLYNAQLEAIHNLIGHGNGGDHETEIDLEMIEINRKIEANDWQLTFVEGQSPESENGVERAAEERQQFLKQMRESMATDVPGSKVVKNGAGQFITIHVDDQGNVTVNGKQGDGIAGGDESDGKQELMEFGDHQRIVYMPTIRDGVIDETHDVPNKVIEEVNIIRENYYQQQNRFLEIDHDKENINNKPTIKITQDYLMKAMAALRPSVSPREQLKYQKIYENFVKSRGGDFGQSQPSGEKRATLA